MNDNIRCSITEEELAAYLAGALAEPDRKELEKHLASCRACRELLVEADEILSQTSFKDILRSARLFFKTHIWAIMAICFLAMSFVFRGYFLQFLAASFLAGAKSIIDSRTSRLLVMIDRSFRKEPEKQRGALMEKLKHGDCRKDM